jgi:hypothetical protein
MHFGTGAFVITTAACLRAKRSDCFEYLKGNGRVRHKHYHDEDHRKYECGDYYSRNGFDFVEQNYTPFTRLELRN